MDNHLLGQRGFIAGDRVVIDSGGQMGNIHIVVVVAKDGILSITVNQLSSGGEDLQGCLTLLAQQIGDACSGKSRVRHILPRRPSTIDLQIDKPKPER